MTEKRIRRPDGQIIRLPNGRWKGRITRIDETGRRRSPAKTFDTKKAAQKWIREQSTAVEAGTFVEPSRETVAEHLKAWLQTVKPALAPRTWRDYSRNLRRYVIPRFGGMKLANLRVQHIQTLYAELSERGLGPRSVRIVHNPLRQACAQAVAWGKIAKSPTDG